MEPVLAIKGVEKLCDWLIEKGGSILQGGPEGKALVETAESRSNGNEIEKKGLVENLYRWCMSQSFKETVEEAKRGQNPLSLELLLKSLKTEKITLDEDTVKVFIQNLEINFAAEDDRFAARLESQRFGEVFNQLDALKQTMQFGPSELSAAQEANIELRGLLNGCKILIDQQKVLAARKLLEPARASKDSNKYSKASLARIANMFGVCALRLDEIETAEEEFKTAYRLNPEDANILANKANVLMLGGKNEDALTFSEKAVERAPNDSAILATHINALSLARKFDEVKTMLSDNPQVETHAACLMALGQDCLNQGDWQNAVRFFQKGCDEHAKSAPLHYLLGRALFLPIQTRLLTNTPLDGKLDPEDEATLRIVIAKLTTAIELTEEQDYIHNRVDGLINRAGVLLLLNDRAAAWSDINEAIRLEPSNINVLMNKGRLLMAAQDFQAAADVLETIPQMHIAHTAKTLAETYYRLERYSEALDLLRRVWDANDGEHINVHLAERYVELEHMLNGAPAANALAEGVLARYGRSPDALRIKSLQLMRCGLNEDAVPLLIEAKDKALMPSKIWFSLDLAHAYKACGRKNFTANEEYGWLCNQTYNETIWVEFIVFLSQQQLYFAAYKRAKDFREHCQRPVQGVTDQVEFGYLMEQRQFTEARDLLLSAEMTYPLTAAGLFNLALSYFYLGDMPQARSTLGRVDQSSLNAHELSTVKTVESMIRSREI